VLNFLPIGYITTDFQGQILETNQRAADIFNVAQKSLHNKILYSLIDDRDIKDLEKMIQSAQVLNDAQNGEFRLKSSSKEESWLGIQVVVNKDYSDEFNNILVITVTNINQCTFKLGVDKLEEKYIYLNHLLKTSPAVIFSCQPSGNYPATYVSENIYQAIGYSADQFINTPNFWTDHIHPDDKPGIFNDLQKLPEKNYLKHLLRFQHQNGKYRWIEEELRLVRDEKGKAQEIVGSWNDVTEKLKAEDSAQSLASIIEESLNEVYIFSAKDLHFLYVNQKARENLGYSSDELFTLTPLDLKKNITAEKFTNYLKPLKINSGKSISFTTEHQRHDGSEYPVEVHIYHTYYQTRKAYVAIILNISERVRAQKENILISQVMKQSNEGIMITDLSNRIISVNSALCNTTGYSENELLGENPSIIQSGRHDKKFYKALFQSLETNGVWEGEIWNRNKKGEIYSEWLKIYVIKDTAGNITNYVGHASDIISQKKIRERLQYLAHYDSLTGLCNRYFFMELLENAIAINQREEKKLCLLFIDLDGFKLLNDTHGHLFGDEVLKQVAHILSSTVRKSDIVARFSGDEFVAVLTGLNKPGYAEDIAKIILESLSTSIDINGVLIKLYASIGISYYPKDGDTSEILINKADKAMYRAKKSQKNHYCLSEDGD